jgi:hypothetical protein
MGMTGVSNLKAWTTLLVVGLLGTLLVLALSACGGAGGSAQEEAKARPLPEEPKALRPGEYRSEEFKPSFSFRVGKGWQHEPLETPDKLAILRPGDQGATLIFRNLQDVYKPSTATSTMNVVEAPKDMVGWFQHHPYLDTEKPKPVTVGGVKGVQFDYAHAEDAPVDDVPLFSYSDGTDAGSAPGYKFRAIILEDVKGETVTIGMGTLTGRFEEFAPKAQKVLDSVKWSGS